jgi:hypothetical protein
MEVFLSSQQSVRHDLKQDICLKMEETETVEDPVVCGTVRKPLELDIRSPLRAIKLCLIAAWVFN